MEHMRFIHVYIMCVYIYICVCTYWWKVKKESEKAGLKLNIQKTKIMASGPITSWQIDEETMKTLRNFIFMGS